jgi:hypothetical protein
MKRDRLVLSQSQSIETGRDWNGRFFIAYSSGASVFIRDITELRRFLKIPKSIPMRASLDSWLESLADMDAQRKEKVAEPVGDANVEGSWDPQAHGLDESDPQFQTRMIT